MKEQPTARLRHECKRHAILFLALTFLSPYLELLALLPTDKLGFQQQTKELSCLFVCIHLGDIPHMFLANTWNLPRVFLTASPLANGNRVVEWYQ